jgi:hypothetical protein|tara:strand:- start:188 stop:775 length:588 start_codon:yes stop_codon:yes gene_type:complete
MTTTNSPFGLRPSRMRGSGSNSNGMNDYPVSTGYNTNIFTGDIVKNQGGVIKRMCLSTDRAIGVFMGCRFTAANGTPTWSPFWPAGTVTSDAQAMVVDNPAATFIIQADASLSAGSLNSFNFDVTFGAGNTATGMSGFGLQAASAVSISRMLRIIRFVDQPGNNVINSSAERAFPLCEVRLVQNVDAYLTVEPSS